ncbi:MAG: cytochrome C [Gammaproteobacteria bacterium]|jgi:hypothetical protein
MRRQGLLIPALALLSATGFPFAAGAVDTSGWDWGAVEGMTDTPVVEPRRDSMPQRTTPAPPPVAAPDLEAPPTPAYALFLGMPEFEVIQSTRDTEMHPCGNCHRWAESDPTPRPLQAPHDNFVLRHGLHGKGQFWCFTCHDLAGDGSLRTLDGEPLGFDEAYLLCTQCHVDKGRDWAFGAHGKRADNWRGPRRVYNCTACHYQHAPALLYRDAAPGPVARQGLERPVHWVPKAERAHPLFEHPAPWQRDRGQEPQ